MTERWKADADGILVFTGLFSAAVATFIGVSIQDLRPNSQDASAFYLANIYQLLADANGSTISVIPSLPDPSQFSPSISAVWVNSLWFLSLLMSLTCALLATLLQQWARRFLRVTHPRYGPHKRSCIRAFFSEGIDKLHLPWAVEALPTLLHTSLFLFFAGLVVFLFNIHHTVFGVVLWWVGLCTGTYLCITVLPIFRHDSPYYTPLSYSVWLLVSAFQYTVFRFLSWLVVFHLYEYDTWRRFDQLKYKYQQWFLQGMTKAAEETAQVLTSDIDGRALLWTFESLDEDHELERFFAAIPGFCNSTAFVNPLGRFIGPNDKRLSAALVGFMERALSSKLISDTVKQRRIIICTTAIDAASLSASKQILVRALLDFGWGELFHSVQFGLFARRWSNGDDPLTTFCAKCAVSIVIARAQNHDENWFDLATGQLGVSITGLRGYLAHGDSLSFANLIFLTRHVFLFHRTHTYHTHFYSISVPILKQAASNIAIEDVLPVVRVEFCGLWNQLVDAARMNDDHHSPIIIRILKRVRGIYVALHNLPRTDPLSIEADDNVILNEVTSYPRCITHRHDRNPAAASPHLSPNASLTTTRTSHTAIPPLPSTGPPTTTQYGAHSPTSAPPNLVSPLGLSHQTPALTDAPSTRGEPQPEDSTTSPRSAAVSQLISVPNRDVAARTRTDPPPSAASDTLVDDAETPDRSSPATNSRSQGSGLS
ncbi:hypothetical protein EDB87DRAFT_1693470 [Lactarius vividus]|nr:hypothetical protein EDB87DRAFT_1693470 [Lactarius vividus]